MTTEIGEYIVGAYLKLILKCDVIDYNVRPSETGLEGLNELDVIGFNFKDSIAYLCEVSTHIRGMHSKTFNRFQRKHSIQIEYANNFLADFKQHRFMLWSPRVPVGKITTELKKMEKLKLVINEDYTACIDQLRQKAREIAIDIGNPFFRTLQILEHLR